MESWLEGLAPQMRQVIMLFLLLYPLGVFVAYCFFLRCITSLFKSINPVNRAMRPAWVWLLLLGFVPYFGRLLGLFLPVPFLLKGQVAYLFYGFAVILQLFTTGRLAVSISAEYRARGLPVAFAPTFKRGIAYGIANLLQLLLLFLYRDTALSFPAWCLVMLTWVVYWIGVARYKSAIGKFPAGAGQDSIFFAHNA